MRFYIFWSQLHMASIYPFYHNPLLIRSYFDRTAQHLAQSGIFLPCDTNTSTSHKRGAGDRKVV